MALGSKKLPDSGTPPSASAALELIAEFAILRIPTDQIDVQSQVRTEFDEVGIADLAEDIEKVGQLQPAVVRPHPDRVNRYILVMGGRRYRACESLGRHLLAFVVNDVADAERIRDVQWSENHFRAALSLQDQAAVFRADLAVLGTQAAVAKHRKVSEGHVSSLLRVAGEAQVAGSTVANAMQAGVTDVDDLNTLSKVALKSPTAAKGLIEKARTGGKSIRAEARETKRVLDAQNGKRTGEAVAMEIYSHMAVGSNGAERTLLHALSVEDHALLAAFLRPFYLAGENCEVVNATRTLHVTCFAKESNTALLRWTVAAFMAGLVGQNESSGFSLDGVLDQAAYDALA